MDVDRCPAAVDGSGSRDHRIQAKIKRTALFYVFLFVLFLCVCVGGGGSTRYVPIWISGLSRGARG